MKPWAWHLRDHLLGALIWVLCIILGVALMFWDFVTRRKPDPPEIGND